jgi:phosphate transport system substrate-binding protein
MEACRGRRMKGGAAAGRALVVGALLLGAGLGASAQMTPGVIVVDGSTTVGPIAKAFAEYYMALHKDVNVTVSESGSGNGAKALMNGTCDVADMSRFMKPDEFKAAIDRGVTPIAQVVALDGIAIVVHPANPVAAITGAQIRDVYAGRITNWKQLGGPDLPIVVVSRDTNSGTYETFDLMLMKGEKIAGAVEYLGSNGAIRQKVQGTPAAIGYVGLGFADRTVKTLAVDGVAPSRETVTTGEYEIARPLFMFTNGYPKIGSPLYNFVTLYLTRKGQDMVTELGFVPVTAY